MTTAPLSPAAQALRPSLRRPPRAGRALSLTPLVDVLLILVVFFLVTSTYLDLTMVPMVETEADAPASALAPPGDGPPGRLLVRLSADGEAVVQGRVLDGAALAETVAARPGGEVLILPSPLASTQALVSVLDALALGGAGRVRVVRIGEGP